MIRRGLKGSGSSMESPEKPPELIMAALSHKTLLHKSRRKEPFSRIRAFLKRALRGSAAGTRPQIMGSGRCVCRACRGRVGEPRPRGCCAAAARDVCHSHLTCAFCLFSADEAATFPLPRRCWCKRAHTPVHKGDERRGSSTPPRREIADYPDRRRGRRALSQPVLGA